jgi:hypothetical protein
MEVQRPRQVTSAHRSQYSAKSGSLLDRTHVFAELSSGELGVALRARAVGCAEAPQAVFPLAGCHP